MGSRLRAIRGSSDTSLRTAASRMGISPAYLSTLERGRGYWSQDLIDRFSRAIRRDIQWIKSPSPAPNSTSGRPVAEAGSTSTSAARTILSPATGLAENAAEGSTTHAPIVQRDERDRPERRPIEAAIDRLTKYSRERKRLRGIDHEDIHGINVGDEREAVLLLSDIDMLLDRIGATGP